MTDLESTAGLENPEDDWARGVFDRVRTGQHEPHWIPDAAAAARLSSRHRTRFRAAGALAAVAVAGLSATAFTTLGGSLGRAGAPTTVPPAAGQTTWTGLDLTRYLEISGAWKSDSGHMTTQSMSPTGLTTVSTILRRLDPDLKHIRTTSGQHTLDITPPPAGTSIIDLTTSGYWAPNGDVSHFPPMGTRYRPTTPFGFVDITVTGPQPPVPQADKASMPNTPCEVGNVVTAGPVPMSAAWSPCTRSHQSDDSDIVISHSANLPAGEMTFAARVFADGSSVQIMASTVIGYASTPAAKVPDPAEFVAGPALDPVPWTDDSLAKALTGPGVKALS